MRFLVGAFLLLITGPTAHAAAKIDFALYEGQPVIKTGTGGTRITRNGIDYWTTGEPPRRYQVIGSVQDKRDEMWDGGHAVGSPSIASKVKKAGGDAVIILSEDEAGHGGSFSSVGGGGFGSLFGWGMGGSSKTVTRMVVVRYLPEDAASTSSTTPAAHP